MEISPIFDQLTKNNRITFSQKTLDTFCQKWQITDVWLFGSVLRHDFRPDRSDIDILVTFEPKAPWTLLDIVEMEQELGNLAGRRVDLIEKRVIDRSDNPIRKAEILNSAQLVYSQTINYVPA